MTLHHTPRRRSRAAALVLALITGSAALLVPGGAARADEVVVGVEGTATEHAAGYPATSEPWRTLTQSTFVTDDLRRQWTGTINLAGPVPPGSKIDIAWHLGRQQPNGCEVLLSVGEPSSPVAADGTFTITRTYVDDDFAQPFTCMAALVFTDDVLTDWLTGSFSPNTRTSGVQAAPAGGRFLVAAGRSTPAIVMVTSHTLGSKGATVSVAGRRVDVPGVETGAIAADRARPVVVRVKAKREGRSEVALSARDGRDSGAFDARYDVVAKTIEAQRPMPGRYESADGDVRLVVTPRFKVKALSVDGVRCNDDGQEYGVRLSKELRVPRTGATARVIRVPDQVFGTGYYGVQLLTTSPRRVAGTFAVATYGCTGSTRFVADLQR